MKNGMLKTTCAAIMLFIAGNLFAQATKTVAPESKHLTQDQRADRSLQKMTGELTLTSDQQPKVREILLTSIKQHDADKASTKGDAAKYKELNEKRMREKREALKKVLTPDQDKKLEEMWKNNKDEEGATKKDAD
jgi:Spy/CpxP family protein refolding chaperone